MKLSCPLAPSYEGGGIKVNYRLTSGLIKQVNTFRIYILYSSTKRKKYTSGNILGSGKAN
jgi:hypothetical protein